MMLMQKFIRIDTKGEWMGTEHVSSVQGQAGECVCFEDPCVCGSEESWESGISCYRINENDQADALRELLTYWTGIAMLQDEADYEGLQITVFEGELIGRGADGEDTATCTKTLTEVDAKPVIDQILQPYFDEWYDMISHDELDDILNSIKLL